MDNVENVCVGSIDSGILSMNWSPDQEIVVFVTGEKKIIEMNKFFDVLNEIPIDVEEFGEDVQVNVGWGKKETQFHGAGEKQLAKIKIDKTKIKLSEDDDFKIRISWRGDGEYFVCSSVGYEGKIQQRKVRVYNRDCILQSTNEIIDQLEHTLCWRPSGNLIASSQKFAHKHNVIFLERNGLKHGEFTIREPLSTKIIEVLWNFDSSVLALWMERYDDDKQVKESVVQIWSMNNYHWYLKQEHIFNKELGMVSSIEWDPEKPLKLHIITTKYMYLQYDYEWLIFSSTFVSENDPATVIVIDGKEVLYTPFRYQNVPPPMSSFKVNLEENASYISFAPINIGDDFCVLLSNNTAQFFKSKVNNKPIEGPSLIGTIKLPGKNIHYRQLTWINEDTLIAISHDLNVVNNIEKLLCIKIKYEGNEISIVKISEKSFEDDNNRIVRLICNSSTKDILMESTDASLYSINIDENLNIIYKPFEECLQLNDICPWLAVTYIGKEQKTKCVIGLTPRNRLYANEKLIVSNCTSFYIHSDFLIFTTLTHTARFLPLNIPFDDFKINDDGNNVSNIFDESIRRIERGSKIVTAVKSNISLVLQMPRGNLETVCPRALVLMKVRNLLDKYNYKDALIICRKHRIDMNILCDHNLEKFIENIEMFVNQVDNRDYFNLFISGLKNEDITKGMYKIKDYSSNSNQNNPLGINLKKKTENKINKICNTIRKTFESIDKIKYLQPILTTYVKSEPPQLEEALYCIKSIKANNQPELADKAVKYIIFLVNVDKLYNIALGLYDFELVLMIAQHSQKDPREYIPFLQNLQKLEPNYQHFKINDYLERFEKALKCLSISGDQYFNDCLEYIKNHILYNEAMKIFKYDEDKYKKVLLIYAEYLASYELFNQAALSYWMAKEYNKAIEYYQKTGSWREIFTIATSQNYNKEKLDEIANNLIEQFQEEKLYEDAAYIYIEYLNDPKQAVIHFLKSGKWLEAIRLYNKHHLQKELESQVISMLISGQSRLITTIKEYMELYTKQASRLVEIRIEKQKKLESGEIFKLDERTLDGSTNNNNIDILPDTMSMASKFTGFTAYTLANSLMTAATASINTGKGGRKRRKLQRKMMKGKKGSIYEEGYLINSLRKTIQRLDDIHDNVKSLCQALLQFNKVEAAKELQDIYYNNAIMIIKPQIDQIFIPTPVPETVEQIRARLMSSVPIAAPTIQEEKPKLIKNENTPLLSWPFTMLEKHCPNPKELTEKLKKKEEF
ncbi:IkappaB kinase complex, IKAP component [Anaeromyces robustus]|uniref:Elongator complex protein 1 n=1 Tax=Anaeromyces robustus TaxID=1754192 RepID=A0A1Y1XAI3_9FUNG|nr:IkappaB kinase complex, IKAP component [Anaeromyces robustus]|eukprot:ORX82781.1 IkappaB kinase complex, IKAP component [Anaeromyces robustus]